jgi:LEA14-like dessication related protein
LKRNGLIILGLLAVAAGVGYYQSLRQTVQSLTAKVANFHFDYKNTQSSVFTRIYFTIDVLVNNPTLNPITVTGISFSIFYKGASIATANKNEPVIINPQSTTTFKVSVFASVFSLFKTVQDAINSLSSGVNLDLDLVGGVTVPAGVIKLDQKVSVRI